MDLEIGDVVYVQDNIRSKGFVGGWRPHVRAGKITKVNRVTADILLWSNVSQEYYGPSRFRKDRIRQTHKAEETEQI